MDQLCHQCLNMVEGCRSGTQNQSRSLGVFVSEWNHAARMKPQLVPVTEGCYKRATLPPPHLLALHLAMPPLTLPVMSPMRSQLAVCTQPQQASADLDFHQQLGHQCAGGGTFTRGTLMCKVIKSLGLPALLKRNKHHFFKNQPASDVLLQ